MENRIAAIEEEMQANGSDFSKLATLQKNLDEKNEALLEKYERYEYLSDFDSLEEWKNPRLMTGFLYSFFCFLVKDILPGFVATPDTGMDDTL